MHRSISGVSHFSFTRVIVVLAAVVYVGNYYHVNNFGLYEDDYFYTAPAYGQNFHTAWSQAMDSFRHWPQGRPIGFAATALIAWVTASDHSLLPAFMFGFVLLVINSLLLYLFLARRVPATVALLAATLYALYPIDTSKVILMHRGFQLLNFTFLFLACILYDRWRPASYAVAMLCLLTYEPIFLPFLLIPLAPNEPGPIRLKSVLLHLAICILLVGAVLQIRSMIGDQRLVDASMKISELLYNVVTAPFIGGSTALTALVQRPWSALFCANPFQLLLGLGVATGLYACSFQEWDRGFSSPVQPNLIRHYIIIAMLGAIAIPVGYLMAFRPDNYPPIITVGRLTAFNAPSSIGVVLAASGLLALASTLRSALVRRLVLCAASLYVGLLCSYGLEVQETDYVQNWGQQTRFWQQIVQDSGDWTPTTPILVDIRGSNEDRPLTPGFPVFWIVNYPPVLTPQLIVKPAAWNSSTVPRVYGYYAEIAYDLGPDNLILHTPAWAGSDLWPTVHDHAFLYYRFSKGRLVRVLTPVEIGGRLFTPKAVDNAGAPLAHTALYNVLFGRQPEWPIIAHSRNYPR